MTYVYICPVCGTHLICRTDGLCYCPWCGFKATVLIKGVKEDVRVQGN